MTDSPCIATPQTHPPQFRVSSAKPNHNFPTPPTTDQAATPARAQSNPLNNTPDSSLRSSPGSINSYPSGDTRSLDDFSVLREESSTGEETATPFGMGMPMPVDNEPLNLFSFLEPFQHSALFCDDLFPDNESEDNPGSLPVGPELPNIAEPISFSQLLDEDHEDIEEIIRQSDLDAGPWNFTLPGQLTGSFDMSQFPGQLAFAPESQEMLAMRFDRITCGILSIKDGVTENPWRTQVWPLAKNTPALYHALFALSAFHSAKENPSLRVQGVKHMRRSITCLRQQIQNMRADTALATSLALAFADTWDQNTRTCIQHLRGAKALMLQVLNAGLQGDLNSDELDRVRFLYNTWTYMDVIARLTSLDESGPQDLNPSIFHLPGDAIHEIDPLMGCAATLFPLIGRVARLVQRVRKTPTNSLLIVSQAMELKTLIEQWEPPRWFEPPEDPISEVQHSIQVAHAYRWATLLYLHQAVPEMPSEPPEELAKRVLILLATVPPSSRTTIIQMFPLLAAGAEVDGEDDRRWVLGRWNTVQSRLMLGGIDRCLDVLREVWARRDAHAVEKEQQQEGLNNSRRPGSFSSENKGKANANTGSSNAKHRHDRVNSNDHDRSMQSQSGTTSSRPGLARRGSALSPLGHIEFERTVRSRLHWVNVMGEWGWEGETALVHLMDFTDVSV